MEDVPKLPDEHLDKAKEIISRHRTRKNCKSCFDRGYQGINQLNMAITCHKCVDMDEVTKEWQAYVRETPALAETYGDYFEADEVEEGGEGKPKTAPEPTRQSNPDRLHRHGGPKTHRSVGR